MPADRAAELAANLVAPLRDADEEWIRALPSDRLKRTARAGLIEEMLRHRMAVHGLEVADVEQAAEDIAGARS